MSPACVNEGGAVSLIQLAEAAQVGRHCTLADRARVALGCWRPRRGEALTLMDAEGKGFRARVLELTEERAVLLPFEALESAPESPVRIEVYQALPQRERFELIVQKLTEVGVTRIVPYESQRSITQQERDAGQKKSHRWPEVVLKAAKQCRRAMLPELFATCSWDAALAEARHADLRLVFYESRQTRSLRAALDKERPRRIALFVGPEGGFTEEELAELQACDVLPVSLGPRILRTETAAIVGASLVQHRLGDLD